MKLMRYTILSLFLLFGVTPCFAYYETLQTGEVLNADQYNVGLNTQFITDHDSGVNFSGRVETGYNEEFGLGAHLGFGTTDFVAGAYVKWVPIPDYEEQPAIGLTAGLLFARIDGYNEVSVRANPFVGKRYQTDHGNFSPYASVPIGIRSFNGETTFPIQLALGTEFEPVQFEHIRFMGEIGFNIHKAFTYITLGAVFEIDDENGLQLN